MAQKKMDAKMEVLEQELEMVKEQLQRIPRIERSLQQLAQNVVRSLQTGEETQRMVAALANSDGAMGGRAKGSSQPKERTPERPNATRVGQEIRTKGPSLLNRDWHGGRRLKMPIFIGENPDG